MSTVVIAPSNVVTFPEGGGHFWVYMHYVQGLLSQGGDVYWLESFNSSGDPARDQYMLNVFEKRMEQYGLNGKTILYTFENTDPELDSRVRYINTTRSMAETVFHHADLLLNFYYAMEPDLLAQFRTTALVDIDPGLLQFWMSTGQLYVSPHDYYCTTGETVGQPGALFPDCGLDWITIRPPVSLELWPYSYKHDAQAFTTVSSWWGGGGKGEFITDGDGLIYENNKRVTFLEYVELPQKTDQPIELALNLGSGDEENTSSDQDVAVERLEGVTDYISDAVDRNILLEYGWRITDPYHVAASPEAYQYYILNSRGEFSCVKPSCLKFQNAWVSDRTVCYLASGRPAVVQNTGPSSYLPDGEGMFRFSSIEEAVDAFSIINADYEKHCRAAREIAEAFFDSRKIVATILDKCCG